MKNLKILSIVSVLFLAMVISFSSVEAATESCSLKIGLSSSTTSINVGDEISVSVKINSVTGFDGIHIIVAKKVYDPSIFEYIGCNPQNSWDLRGDASNIILYRKSGDVSTGTICTLKFKVLKASTGIISLTNIDATGNNGDVYYEDGNVNFPSISFKISEKVQSESKIETPVPSTRDNVTTTTRGDKVESKVEPKVDTKTETASTTITTTTEVSKATLENNNTSSSNNTVSINNNDSQNEVSTTENNVIFNNVGNNTNLNDNAILETLEVSSNTQASQTLEDSNLDTSIKDISIEVDNTSKTVTVIIISTVLGASVLGVTIYYFISIKKH